MSRAFLTAHWSNLCIISYAVDPSLLEAHLPRALELDTRDDRAYVSLVAFDFLRTRVWRACWPGLTNFPEINLRFYVRDGERRGVCFLREFVPRRLVALAARTLYNEPYCAAPMQSRASAEGDWLDVDHRLTFRGRTSVIQVRANGEAAVPAPGSLEHYFKEHAWGFGADRRGRTVRYRVSHPVWKVRHARIVRMDWDWEGLHGKEWGHLRDARPASVFLACGSPVEVFGCERCEDTAAVAGREPPAAVGAVRAGLPARPA